MGFREGGGPVHGPGAANILSVRPNFHKFLPAKKPPVDFSKNGRGAANFPRSKRRHCQPCWASARKSQCEILGTSIKPPARVRSRRQWPRGNKMDEHSMHWHLAQTLPSTSPAGAGAFKRTKVRCTGTETWLKHCNQTLPAVRRSGCGARHCVHQGVVHPIVTGLRQLAVRTTGSASMNVWWRVTAEICRASVGVRDIHSRSQCLCFGSSHNAWFQDRPPRATVLRAPGHRVLIIKPS